MQRVRRSLPVSFALLGLLGAAPVQAQQPPDGSGPSTSPYQPAPSPYQPAPSPYQPNPYQPAPPPYQPAPPPVVAPPYQPAPPPYQPTPPPVVAPPLPPTTTPAELLGAPATAVPPTFARRFRTGRILYGVGSTVGLIGSGLTLSGIGVSFAYGVSDLTLGLTYAGSSAAGAGVILTAVGLGLQHSALRSANADPGRGLYALGTMFGVLGLAGIATSYYFGGAYSTAAIDSNYGAIAFGASVSAAVLLGVGSVLYFVDAQRMLRISHRLTRF
jgi:hypothetical protein